MSLCAPQAITLEEKVGAERVAARGARQHCVNVVDAQRLALLALHQVPLSPQAMRNYPLLPQDAILEHTAHSLSNGEPGHSQVCLGLGRGCGIPLNIIYASLSVTHCITGKSGLSMQAYMPAGCTAYRQGP